MKEMNGTNTCAEGADRKMKVVIGYDFCAEECAKEILRVLSTQGYSVTDFGSDIYTVIALRTAQAVASGEFQRGILVCGSGVGVCMAANKVNGAYAALVTNELQARKSNICNIIALGAQITEYKKAAEYALTYLEASAGYTPQDFPEMASVFEREQFRDT